MKISKQARRGAKELFRAAQVNGVLDDARARQVVDQVIAAKPRGYVSILSHFQRLVKLYLESRSARVESFSPLTPEQRNEMKAGLEKRFGGGLNFSFAQNPELLGGVRIKVGSDVFDGSVRARLNQLEESFEAA